MRFFDALNIVVPNGGNYAMVSYLGKYYYAKDLKCTWYGKHYASTADLGWNNVTKEVEREWKVFDGEKVWEE